MALTERDLAVFEAVGTLIERNGYAPSLRQIAREMKLASPSGIHTSLQRLRDAKKLTWEEGQPRTLRLVDA